jgi:hypothetical protein
VDALGRILCRRTSSNTVEQTFYICHAKALAFSEDGGLLAAAGGPNGSPAKLKVWRTSDRRQLCEIMLSDNGASLIAISSDERFVVHANQGHVVARRISDGQPQWSRSFPSAARSLRFSADGKTLFVRDVDGINHSLDPASGRESAPRITSPK